MDEAPSRALHLVGEPPEQRGDRAVQRTLEAIPQPALAVAFDGTVLSINAAGCESGYFDNSEPHGWALIEAVDDVGGRHVSDALSAMAAGRFDSAEVAVTLTRELGQALNVTLTLAVVRDERDVHSCAVVLVRDESRHGRDDAELRHRASHDGLTELPNRAAFLHRLVQALARDRRRASMSAVLFIDLDGFKSVNDSLGHPAGDELLFSAAGRIRRVMRPEDTLARYGGDEFTVLCEDLHVASEADAIALRVLEVFDEPFVLSVGTTSLTASVGVAVVACGSRDAADVVVSADAAMYTGKHAGGDRFTVHDMTVIDAAEDSRFARRST